MSRLFVSVARRSSFLPTAVAGPSTTTAAPLRRLYAATATPTPALPKDVQETNALAAEGAAKVARSHPPSSTPAGTPIPEVVIHVNQKTPIALEDAEYPDWLWTLIGEGRQAAKASGGKTDPRGEKWAANASKRAVRKANREAIKTSNLLKSS